MAKIIAERYELLELIGQGGMADVYLAQDIILNRTIAIKILRTSLAKDPIYVTRFQREASAAAALSHKNIVEIYDVGEDEDKYYIVMEYVPGMTLKELILKRGAVHVVEAIDIMKQVISGISKAHQLGIIHRDLKPQNILVTDSGVAKIADFGIASMQSLAQVTQTDVIMGSLHYLAPELARGEKATAQSDVYALGIVFYELLRGEVPFNGESPVNIALKHMQEDLPSLLEFNPSIPQSVENIVIKATAKNLNDRYKSATEMLDDIKTCMERQDEEKLVFSHDQDTDPTIVIDPRSAFTSGNTAPIVDPVEEKEVAAPKKEGFFSKLVNKFKGLDTKAKVAVGVVTALVIAGIAFAIYLGVKPDTSLMPDLTEKTVEQAKEILKEYNVTISDDITEELSDEYEKGEIIATDPKKGTTIKEGDVVIFFNYRNDRAKELTVVLTQQDMPEQGMHTIPGLQYYCMTPYDASFKGVHILFDKENVANTLGEYIASKGLSQLHIAETEKYAHVTFFFNGGRETPFDNEDRILVPSPKVATYDLKPEMSAYEVKDKLVDAINENKYDFIVVNFANGDMVGHTGIYEAIEKAVVAVDACVKDVIEAAKAQGYEAIIIADHGNADHALNEDGTPNTAHSLNPVPCVYVTGNKAAKVEDGRLADVAPTILKIMGLEAPADMNGQILIK